MSVIESIGMAAFLIAFAFVVLGLIFVIIHLFSYLVNLFFTKETAQNKSAEKEPQHQPPYDESLLPAQSSYDSELTLIDTTEEIAAMIMAIVSDESGIPLSELNFKSIKLLTKESY